MTFAATAEVVLYFKAKPVLVDCQPDTLNLDPTQIEAAITAQNQSDYSGSFRRPTMRDGSDLEYRQKAQPESHRRCGSRPARPVIMVGRVGTIGDITCFSFYATKTITTGEGGMATTENSEWAERMRMMSLHGISHDAWKRYTKEGSWYYEVLYPGFKYNLTDIAAAIGIEQLKKCNEFWEARQRIAMIYAKAFADLQEIQVPACRNDVQHAWHLFVIQLNLERLKNQSQPIH